MKKSLLLLSLLPLPALAGAAQGAPLWLRDAKISPDGSQIAFTYKGDIFTVPVAGGEARRITSRTSYESNPVWSPDSKSIAFASDLHGNFDIFLIPATGGEWKRLTYNSASEYPETFTPDGKKVMYSAAIQDPASSALYPSGRMTELYEVPVGGGAPVQILATPARYVSWTPDGKSFLYQDVKGFEDEWRKHHTSSVTRDIWRYTPSTGKHTQLTDRGGEDLNPVDAGKDIYFLSEPAAKGASINVYRAPGGNMKAAKAVTSFKKHPVRFLSRANNGTLCFTYDGELYTLANGSQKPKKVSLNITGDFPEDVINRTMSSGASEAAVSPDGKAVAFINRGDVFVTSTDYRTTKAISRTPEAESDVTWCGDSMLYYVSERDGLYNIYRATVVRNDEEPGFVSATLIREEPVFKTDKHERTAPRVSPDGKSLAFILDRNKLAVMDLKSKKVRELTDGSTYLHRNGGFYYRWSPDSKWIALEMVDRRHDPYTDVAIINVADGTLTNITNSGYFDAEPKWILGGNALLFASERYGMRNHASWGSQMDVMFVFLNQKAYDDFMLSKEESELNDEIEKLKKEKAEKKEKDSKNDDKDKKDSKDKKDEGKDDIKVELAGIEDRIVRVTPISTDLRDAMVTSDGKTLLFICDTPAGNYLCEMDLKEKNVKMKTKLSGRFGFDTSADGKTIFLLGSSFNKLSGSSLTPVSYSAQMNLDPAAERRFMLDNIEREERERFYTADMHGVQWASMVEDYRKFLPHINNNYDFAEMLSELLGELNVSHTGARYGGGSGSNSYDRTAALGALFDMNYSGPGMRIEEVLEKGPLYGLDPVIEPGSVLLKINGETIDDTHTLSQLLNNTVGKRTLLFLKDPAGNEREVVVKPIYSGEQGMLLHDRWVKNRRNDVERWSNGRLGYVHISSMDDDSFRKVYSDLLGKYNDREGVVIDIRWNGGGRLHEDIEVLLSGQKYFTQEIRGVPSCDMPSRRWNKPSIMVMSEACYSNAHGTPWVYKNRGLGKLVGMPVPGTMTSVNWVTAQDPTIVYGIPVIGYRLPDGSFLENKQLEPDIKVANSPETVVKGEDSQLKAAVEELLRSIDSKK